MALSYISPVNSLAAAFEQLKTQGVSGQTTDENAAKGVSFADMLKKAMENVTETNAQTNADIISLVTGMASDNLHNIEIEAVKADLALRSMVSVRNKVLDAYSEIMRITL